MGPAIITIGLAILVTTVVWAAAAGKLPANGTVGIRTHTTQRSENAWIAAHRVALRILLPTSIIVVILGVVITTVLPSDWTEAAGLSLLAIYAVAVIGSAVAAQRAAQATAAA